ncbi:MAG: cytochrome C, partial [Gemmatimonadetes bacterium]|nr:cytochrome C [Gemmatimonadota bacterium]
FLGSEVAASCSDCHGAHGVFPAEDERSLTSAANLLQTCRTCHEEAEAGFELYQPHPDPRDREKNPYVFYSFWFMNLLLAGVLGVFLLHTLAWWIRIGVDLRRASSGPGSGGGKR